MQVGIIIIIIIQYAICPLLDSENVEEAARARVRSAWAKFKELSSILTVCGALYHLKGKIYRTCVQSVLIFASLS